MQTKKQPARYEWDFSAEFNGRIRKVEIAVINKATGKVCYTDKADLTAAAERKKAADRAAAALKIEDRAELLAQLEAKWHEAIDQRRRVREQLAAGSSEAVGEVCSELLDCQPAAIRRPLCLVSGRPYAAAWCQVQTVTRKTVDAATGAVMEYNPPLIQVESCVVIVRDDGQLFSSGAVPGARPLTDLGLLVALPSTLPPGQGWSGAGVKRYQQGERPNPAEAFARLVSVVDHYIDFARSLSPQESMCEMVACYILATYFLDAFNVVGYLWPNGEHGAGKTSLLQVVTETAYLGQLILAASSYPTLRDLADYGATLAFDDAEAVMDTKRTDPDKRTLLLAGNRRGATVSVKEQTGDRWVTRHVHTFCPRLFSAIRLPDQVLASRSIIVPLVRSGDEKRSKANAMDETSWPCDRRRLVDDLWALGLANLPELPEHDRQAASLSCLAGRPLEPWRSILAVAHWLQERHGVAGLFDRMEQLSLAYQQERGDYEEHDGTRVLFRALLELTRGENESADLLPKDIAQTMNRIAKEEDLAEADKEFTNARRVGWLMKRQRFRKGERREKGKTWRVPRQEVVSAAQAYGVQDVAPETPAETTENHPTPWEEDDEAF